jgi:hypothetical protein
MRLKSAAAASALLALAMGALQLCSCTAVDTGSGEYLAHGPFREVRIYLLGPDMAACCGLN